MYIFKNEIELLFVLILIFKQRNIWIVRLFYSSMCFGQKSPPDRPPPLTKSPASPQFFR